MQRKCQIGSIEQDPCEWHEKTNGTTEKRGNIAAFDHGTIGTKNERKWWAGENMWWID